MPNSGQEDPLSTSSNPGCLAAILRLFGLRPKPSPVEVAPLPNDPEPYPYRLQDDFLSNAEQSFYLVLKSMMGEVLTVCPKVSLADIFFVIRPHENMSARNRIDRKHVDFLVCEPKTMKPRFAIELDDRSHGRADREERDDFVDCVFRAANLPLIRIPARNAYNTADLEAHFKQALQPGTSPAGGGNPVVEVDESSPAPAVNNPDTRPVCPKCGVLMVLRTARQGAQPGRQFYGCPNYPKCREIIPLWNHMQGA